MNRMHVYMQDSPQSRPRCRLLRPSVFCLRSSVFCRLHSSGPLESAASMRRRHKLQIVQKSNTHGACKAKKGNLPRSRVTGGLEKKPAFDCRLWEAEELAGQHSCRLQAWKCKTLPPRFPLLFFSPQDNTLEKIVLASSIHYN